MQKKAIKLNLSVSDTQVDELLAARINAAHIKPELVLPDQILSPESYNRFRDQEAKQKFREKLLASLSIELGMDAKLLQDLITSLDTHGAVTFGNMIDTDHFIQLIQKYTEKLTTNGSQSWIHSYINFANHPDFLTDKNYCAAFFHPLLVLMMSYAVGGPVRLVDARGKDAEPLAVQAQDNMLHIDNTPFRKEFKVIVTWKKGEASGPSGQNFVFIPGTHKGVRNCQVSEDGKAWSTEDGSIFITKEAVQSVFDLQKKILNIPPTVIEVTHKTKPLTTVFEAGALVHHRYRTKEKNTPRSCIIVAFHRAQDNPGQFLSAEHLDRFAPKDSLLHLMMGSHRDNTEEKFIAAIVKESSVIAEKLQSILSGQKGAEVLAYSEKVLEPDQFEQWKKSVTSSPTVADIKKSTAYFKLDEELTSELLIKMMSFDKHGPINPILYADGHEEVRKWARNRIREMSPTKLQAGVKYFEKQELFAEPNIERFLSLGQLKIIAQQLVDVINSLPKLAMEAAALDPNEKISKPDAFRSLKQLCSDLGEAIVRCSSRDAFLSTSLFLFWACDELKNLIGFDSINALHKTLLAHYITTYVLIEKQIKKEEQLVERKNAVNLINTSGSFDFSEQCRPESDSNLFPAPFNSM
jgi:hypothetical protein